jgi:hypothetical protein
VRQFEEYRKKREAGQVTQTGEKTAQEIYPRDRPKSLLQNHQIAAPLTPLLPAHDFIHPARDCVLAITANRTWLASVARVVYSRHTRCAYFSKTISGF